MLNCHLTPLRPPDLISKCLGLPVPCPAIADYPVPSTQMRGIVNISHMSHIYRYFKAENQTKNSSATGMMYYSSLSPRARVSHQASQCFLIVAQGERHKAARAA